MTDPRLRHFAAMAEYNRWANRRLYADAVALPAEAVHRDVGVYFRSLFATLEHIIQVDRAWAHLLAGGTLATLTPRMPATGLDALRVERAAADEAFIARVAAIDTVWLDTPFEFASALPSWRGLVYRGTRSDMLSHVLNHQTHHRGQAHTALSLLGAEPSALDILVKGMLGE